MHDIRCETMNRLRWSAAVAAAVALACCSVAAAQPVTPVTTPFTSPDTESCPFRAAPGPAIDASEAPLPGASSPAPLPVPSKPVGGGELGRCGVIVPIGAPPVPPDISASGWVLSDLDTGAVLAAKDPHGRYRPASTIKVLLSIVALRSLDLDTIVTGTAADADADGTRVGIGVGGRYTTKQLMQALVMCSGNDAAHAIAMQLGGMDATVARMNAEARRLGALDTRVATPSGLDGPGMSTSPYDMSLFFREAMTIPTFAELIGTEQAQFPGYPPDPGVHGGKARPDFPISNDNHLLYDYPGALGGKTGYTDDARQTFVAGAQRNGHRLAITLMRADVLPIRPWQQAARLLDYGFALEAAHLPAVGTLVVTGPAAGGQDHGAEAMPPYPGDGSKPRHRTKAVALAVGGVIVAALLYAARRRRPRRR